VSCGLRRKAKGKCWEGVGGRENPALRSSPCPPSFLGSSARDTPCSGLSLTRRPIGVKKLGSQKPQIKWAGLFGAGGENKQYGFEPHVSTTVLGPHAARSVKSSPCSSQISLHNVSSFANDELVAIHHPSGTLLEADMLFNLPPTEQYSRVGGIPGLMKWFGSGRTMSPGGLVHSKAADSLTKDKA